MSSAVQTREVVDADAKGAFAEMASSPGRCCWALGEYPLDCRMNLRSATID